MSNIEKDITFYLTIQEANIIFKALGNLPFSEVYELIGKLNAQANEQLVDQNYPQVQKAYPTKG